MLKKAENLNMQKGFSNVLIIGIVFIVIIGILWVLWKRVEPFNSHDIVINKLITEQEKSPSLPSNLTDQNSNDPNWKTYTNTKFGYTIQYPADYKTLGDLAGTNQTQNDNGINVFTPDTEYNNLGGWVVSGLELRVTGSSDETVISNENPETVQKSTSNVIFDKSLTSLLPLKEGVSATAYINPKGADRPYININFIKLDPKAEKNTTLVQISCIGDIERCKQLLPSIISTFKFN